MEKEKMKHAVPLTPFQEKLYAIILQAYQREDTVREQISVESMTIEEVPEMPLPDTVGFHPVYGEAESDRNERVEHILECLIGFIEDHITGLFLLVMTVNMMWLQILSGWLIPVQDKAMHDLISLLKYFLLLITIFYTLNHIFEKAKDMWEKLKDWAQEPLEKEHMRQ